MDEQNDPGTRIIELTEAAHYDFASISLTTAVNWGNHQAEIYIAFIREMLCVLAAEPTLGNPVEGKSGYRVYVAKIKKRRRAHGHRILFREIPGGIKVMRILHTAMQWTEQLDDE